MNLADAGCGRGRVGTAGIQQVKPHLDQRPLEAVTDLIPGALILRLFLAPDDFARVGIAPQYVFVFCRRERVSAPTFYQWRRRLAEERGREGAPLFVPVRVTESAAVEIRLPNGARICMPPGHVESLRIAIETAGRAPRGAAEEDDAC